MDIGRIFNALSDPTRLQIVTILLEKGEQPVSVLRAPFDMSAPAISQHLKVLRDSELVTVKKRAQQRIYSVNDAALNLIANWAGKVASTPPTGALDQFLSRRAQSVQGVSNS